MEVVLSLPLGMFEIGIVAKRFYEIKLIDEIPTAKRLTKKPKLTEPANGIQFGILYPEGRLLRLDILATENEEKAGEIMLRRVYQPTEDQWTGHEKQYKKGFLVQAFGNVGMASIFSGTHFFRPQGARA